jgi:hypothetical protein
LLAKLQHARPIDAPHLLPQTIAKVGIPPTTGPTNATLDDNPSKEHYTVALQRRIRACVGCACLVDEHSKLVAGRVEEGYPGPVLHLSIFEGQGFGRAMKLAIQHYGAAIALGRPFVLDMEIRDKLYTLRSFLQHGAYDWGVPGHILHHKYSDLMPVLSYGVLELNGAARARVKKEAPELLPMDRDIWPADWKNGTVLLNGTEVRALWDGENPRTRNLTIYSPNFSIGLEKSQLTATFFGKKQRDCSFADFQTFALRALFRPTSLSTFLFKKRRDVVLGAANASKYGAIQMRLQFGAVRTAEEHVASISTCIKQFTNISTWWLLSDNPEMAANISAALPHVRSDYSANFTSNNLHSYHASSLRQLSLDRTPYAGPFLDWLSIYHSEVAIISSANSAYAFTGALGEEKFSDKTRSHACGGYFSVFTKRS